jgi:hypothetical protein
VVLPMGFSKEVFWRLSSMDHNLNIDKILNMCQRQRSPRELSNEPKITSFGRLYADKFKLKRAHERE